MDDAEMHLANRSAVVVDEADAALGIIRLQANFLRDFAEFQAVTACGGIIASVQNPGRRGCLSGCSMIAKTFILFFVVKSS